MNKDRGLDIIEAVILFQSELDDSSALGSLPLAQFQIDCNHSDEKFMLLLNHKFNPV